MQGYPGLHINSKYRRPRTGLFQALLLGFVLLFSGCTPGVILNIENGTAEPVQVNCWIKDEYALKQPGYQRLSERLEPGESMNVHFDWQYFTGKELADISSYEMIFEYFSVTLLNSGRILRMDSMRDFPVSYQREGTVHRYIMEIIE